MTTTEKGGIAAALAAAGQDPDACRAVLEQEIQANDKHKKAKKTVQTPAAAAQTKQAAQTVQTASQTQPVSAPQYVDLADVITRETQAAMITLGCPTIDDLFDEDAARKIRGAVLRRIRTAVKRYNAIHPQEDGLKAPRDINIEMFYCIIEDTGDAARLVADEDAGEPGRIIVYHHTGPRAGTWQTWDESSNYLGLLKKRLGLVSNRQIKAIYDELKARLPERTMTLTVPDLVPMRNGMVKLLPLAPIMRSPTDWTAAKGAFEVTPYVLPDGSENPDYLEKYGRDSKYTWCHKWVTNFNPAAKDEILTGPDGKTWSVEQHFADTFPDKPGDARLIWEVMNFALRGTNGGVYIILCDGTQNLSGGGGKSTTALMVTYMLGAMYVTEVSMDDIGSRFGAADIDGKRAIISHETNGNHKPIEDSKRVKQLARQETISLEKKNKDIIFTRFVGMTIQCTNGPIKFAEKNESVWRKQAAIPFSVQFDDPLQGKKTQRDYIKTDFIQRREVREYLAYKALSLGPITEYTSEYLEANEYLIRDMRSAGSSVFTFLDDVMPRFVGNRIPRQYLFEIYGEWCRRHQFRNVVNWTTFKQDMAMWVNDHKDEWAYEEDKARLTSKDEEPILGEYRGTSNWVEYDPGQPVGGPRKWSREAKQRTYRGMLIRRGAPKPKNDQFVPPIILYQLYAAQVISAGHTPQTFAAWEAAGRPIPLYYIGTDGRAVYAGRMLSGDDMDTYTQETDAAAAAAAGDAV